MKGLEEDSMKKGLLLTLVMVAIALSGYRAMGRAPVVDDIKDIIVGDAGATPANTFVYPDAIDLNGIVNDPDGSDDQIIWSFYEPSGTYLINGAGSLADTQAASVINPPTANKIAGPSVTAADPLDANGGYTATVRNATLSPLAGGNTDPGAATPAGDYIAGSAKTITLFASDGSTIGETTFIAYSANDQNDATSPAQAPVYPCITYNFAGSSTNGYQTKVSGGTATFSPTATGICLEVPALGNNDVEWQGPYGENPYGIELVANSVWRCRITAHNSGNAAETVPMWMFLFDNAFRSEDAGRIGANAFAGEFVFLDAPTQGSANTVGVTRTNFECWIAPMAVQTAAWNDLSSGGVATDCDLYNDMRLRFRVFDLVTGPDGSPLGYGADTDLGAVCLDQVQVDRYLLADMTADAVVYDKTITLAGADRWTATAPNSTVTEASGVTITPTVSGGVGWGNDVIKLTPGDGNWGDFSDAQLGDDFPIIWEANVLYMIEIMMSAPASGTPENQGDVIRMGMDCPTNEMAAMFLVDNNSLAASGPAATSSPGTPKATPDTFTAFFYSHNVSNVSVVSARRLRPRIDILNASSFSTGNGVGGLDPTKFHSCKVTKIHF